MKLAKVATQFIPFIITFDENEIDQVCDQLELILNMEYTINSYENMEG